MANDILNLFIECLKTIFNLVKIFNDSATQQLPLFNIPSFILAYFKTNNIGVGVTIKDVERERERINDAPNYNVVEFFVFFFFV